MNPAVVEQFLDLVRNRPPFESRVFTLGITLRELFGWQRPWLQFLPMLPGLAWFAWYWRTARREWSWAEQVPRLAFASVLTTPYTWPADQVVLLPAILQAAIWLVRRRDGSAAGFAAVAYLVTNGLAFVGRIEGSNSFWVLFAPALLLWYLAVRSAVQAQPRVAASVPGS